LRGRFKLYVCAKPDIILHENASFDAPQIIQTPNSSGEGNCQQAGTEQDEAGSGECEETGRREVIVAHDMPP
jgi:hypothetical protein